MIKEAARAFFADDGDFVVSRLADVRRYHRLLLPF